MFTLLAVVVPAPARARLAQQPAASAASPHCYRLALGQKQIDFDPGKTADLKKLARAVDLELAAQPSKSGDLHPDRNTRRADRGLHEIQSLVKELLQDSHSGRQRQLQAELLETATAVNNRLRPPIPETIDFFQTPLFFLERASRPVGKGCEPATNLQTAPESDRSRLDPEPSFFWTRPANLSNKDLFHGFGRTNLLLKDRPLCLYAGPKESFGRNPGFEIECNGKKLKLKFAEVSSEPFATRVFDALGYHTDPTDYAPSVRVRYSRRMLQEFNSRKALKTHFTFLGLIPLFTLELQQQYDPFAYFTSAVLTNGTRWSSAEAKQRLLRHPNRPNPESDPSNFRPEVESAIDYFETVPANVQQKAGKSIGPWDFESLDHCSRRELRGAGILAAWLGWFDTRFDNTRWRSVKHDGQVELEGFFSDLGGVLGETRGLLYARGQLPDAFPWTFTQPALWQGPHRLARPLRLRGYKPIAPTPAFAAMDLQDARWMARFIGSLTEEQIKQALIASGFDSASVRLYLEKLINRRDNMVRDLGLAQELPLLRPHGVNRHFDYDPVSEGPMQVLVAGKIVQAGPGHQRIIKGKLSND